MSEVVGENICVSVRVRPLNKREEESQENTAWRVVEGTTILPSEHNPRRNPENTFAFDHVFDVNSTTQEVYDLCARNIIDSSLQGRNGTIFVYGQTSSGKTHTMHGNASCPGLVPQGIRLIFDRIKTELTQEFLVRCSYIEIYNENITDLLDPKKTNLKIHINPKGGVFVSDVTMPVVASAEAALDLINKGATNRHVGETRMNEASSRSHSIFRMLIESKDKKADGVRMAELNMVDLAGSERQSQTQATGQRLKEGGNINKSLLTLGNVIEKLAMGQGAQHVPFRDSKLTRILEPALGGNSRTAIICTITPAAVHAEETISTLKFATRAKKIKTTATVNECLDDQALLKRYKKEIDQLKKKLRYTSAGGHNGDADLQISDMINDLELLQSKNAALEGEKALQEVRINKLVDLVLLKGGDVNAEVPQRKSKPTSRMSWCPSVSNSTPLANFSLSSWKPTSGFITEESEEEVTIAPSPTSFQNTLCSGRNSSECADMSLCREDSPLPDESTPTAHAACMHDLTAQNNELRQKVAEMEKVLLELEARVSNSATPEELALVVQDNNALRAELEALVQARQEGETQGASKDAETVAASESATVELMATKADLEELRSLHADQQAAFEQLQKAHQELQTTDAETVAASESAAAELMATKADLEELRSLHAEQQAAFEQLQKAHQELQTTDAETVAASESAAAELMATKADLEELRSLHAEQQAAFEQLQSAHHALHNAHQELQTMDAKKVAASESAVAELMATKEDLEELRSLHAEQQAAYTQLQITYQELQNTHQELQNTHQELQKTLDERCNALSELHSAHTLLMQEYEALQVTHTTSMDKFEEDFSNSKKAAEASAQAVSALEENSALLREQIAELNAQGAGQRVSLEQSNAALGTALKEKAELQAALKEANALAGEVARMQSMLEQSESDYLELKEAFDKLEARAATSEKDASEAKARAEAAESAASEMEFEKERDIARADEEKRDLEAQIKQARVEQDDLMARLVDVEEALETKKNEFQELVLSEQELRVENEDLREEIAQGKNSKVAASKRGSMYVGADPSKRMSVYQRNGGVRSEDSFGATSGGDTAALRRELGAKEQRALDAEKAKDKAERALENIKTELANQKEELANLKKDARGKASKLACLEKGKEDSDKEMEKTKARAASAEEKLRVLTQEKNQLASDKGAIEREARLANSKLESLGKDVEKLRSENTKMKETKAACAAAEKKAETLSAELDKAAASIEGLTSEVSRVETELNETAAARAVEAERMSDLQTRYNQVSSELDQVKRLQEDLEQLVEDTTANVKQLEGKLASTTEARDALSHELEELKNMSKHVEKQLSLKEEQVKSLLAGQGIMQEDLQQAEQQVDSLSKRVESLKSDCARMSCFEESNKDLKEQIKILREEQSNTFSSLTDANFELQQLRTEYQALGEDAATTKSDLQVQIARLSDELQVAEEEKSTLRKQFAEFSDTTALMDTTKELESKVSALEQQLLESKREVQDLEKKAAALQESLTESVLAHQSTLAERDEVLDARNKLAEAGQKLASEMEDMQKTNAREKKDIEQVFQEHHENYAKLEIQIATAKEELVARDRTEDKLRGQIEALEKVSATQQAAWEAERAKLEEQMANLNAKIEVSNEKLEASLSSARGEIVSKERMADKLLAQVESLEKEASKQQLVFEADRAKMQEQADSLSAKLEVAQLHSNEMEKTISRLENEKELAQQRFEWVKAEAERKAMEYQLLENTIKEEQACKTRMTDDIQRLTEELAQRCRSEVEHERQIMELQKSAELAEHNFAMSKEGLQKEVASLEKELSDVRNANEAQGDGLNEELISTQKRLENERSKRRQLEQDVQAQSGALKEAQCELEMAQQASASQETELNRLKKEREQMKVQMKSIEQEKVSYEQELMEVRENVSSKEREINRLKDENQSLTETYEKKEKELFHKIVMIKSEYTGRQQRRDKKIENLQEYIKVNGLPLPDLAKSEGQGQGLPDSKNVHPSTEDKENVRNSANVHLVR